MGTILTSPERERPAFRGSTYSAWRSLSWFGLILAVIGFGQMGLYLYPDLAFGSPEWEFATTGQMLGALPLPTMGVAAMIAAAQAMGRRRSLIALTILLFLLVLGTLGLLGLFWTVAPIALKGAPAIAANTIRQTVARTTVNGFGFLVLYGAAAIMVVRSLKQASPER